MSAMVLSDGWPDEAPGEKVWVEADAVPVGGQAAVEIARVELDGYMDHLRDDGLDLIATERQEWCRQAPCPECNGSGEDRSRLMTSAPNRALGEPIPIGPAEPCESCNGTGEQNGEEGYSYRTCEPDEPGAVKFWVLEVVEAEMEVA